MLKVPVTSADHIRGEENALITLLQYGDYECAQSAAAYASTRYVLQYFDDQIRFAYRHFPVSEAHPHAELAAEVSELASDHGKFWKMHDLIYANHNNLNIERLMAFGLDLGLSLPELQRVFQNRIYQPKVHDDFQGGVKSGVTVPPVFFINGRRHLGACGFDDLVSAIDQAVAALSRKVV